MEYIFIFALSIAALVAMLAFNRYRRVKHNQDVAMRCLGMSDSPAVRASRHVH